MIGPSAERSKGERLDLYAFAVAPGTRLVAAWQVSVRCQKPGCTCGKAKRTVALMGAIRPDARGELSFRGPDPVQPLLLLFEQLYRVDLPTDDRVLANGERLAEAVAVRLGGDFSRIDILSGDVDAIDRALEGTCIVRNERAAEVHARLKAVLEQKVLRSASEGRASTGVVRETGAPEVQSLGLPANAYVVAAWRIRNAGDPVAPPGVAGRHGVLLVFREHAIGPTRLFVAFPGSCTVSDMGLLTDAQAIADVEEIVREQGPDVMAERYEVRSSDPGLVAESLQKVFDQVSVSVAKTEGAAS